MEIHIDTRRDSDEEIRKTIRFLQSLIGEETNEVLTSPASSPGSFDLFGDETSTPAPMNMFGSDDDAPSDYSPDNNVPDNDGETVEEESIVEIVEY